MKKTLACLLAASAALLLWASPLVAQAQARTGEQEDFSSVDLTPGAMLDFIVSVKIAVIDNDPPDDSFPPRFWQLRDAKKSASLRAIALASYANHLEVLTKFRNSEEDSQTPKSWFGKVIDNLQKMVPLRTEMEDAIETQRKTDYFRAYEKYLALRTDLAAVLSERPSLNNDELRRIKEANNALRKAQKSQQKKPGNAK